MLEHDKICDQCKPIVIAKDQALTMVGEYLETMQGLNPKFCEALRVLVPEAIRKKK